MSYDIVVVLDKTTHMIIDKCNIAYLDLIPQRTYLSREAYTARSEQQVYNRVLDFYGLDKTKNLTTPHQLKEWRLNTINSDVASKRASVKSSEIDLLLRQRKYSFLIRDSYIREIRKQVKKSADKLTSIAKFLKIFGLLQYCEREDLQNELKSCFLFFIHQLKRLQHRKQIETISKIIVEILKFCVTDFMKIAVLCSSKEDFSFLFKCLKRQKYNFCGIFNDAETCSYPIAWTLINNCLAQLKYLLIFGTTDLYSPKVHWNFFERFYLRFTESCKYVDQRGNWIFNLRPYKKRNYLVMQIIYLFLLNQQSLPSCLPTQVMIILWKNIPDTFLTKNEVLCPYCYRTSWEAELLNFCWLWYHYNVIDQEVSIQSAEQLTKRTLFVGEYSPRCLKHLARCAVRRNMAASYLEPPYYNLVGEIPQELQKYLEIEFLITK